MRHGTTMNADVRCERPHLFLRVARQALTLVLLLLIAGGAWTVRAQSVDSASDREPRINGPSVYGARPHHPFLYRIPAVGVRPLLFSATKLPAGLSLNATTGIISGVTPGRGVYDVSLRVRNSQ